MPSREEHMRNDVHKYGLSQPYSGVHHILDQFAHYPDMRFLSRHRKFLHHQEGIEYIRMRFGEEAGKSAEGHVIDDCGHIPNAVDYYNGMVDAYGGKTAKAYLKEK